MSLAVDTVEGVRGFFNARHPLKARKFPFSA